MTLKRNSERGDTGILNPLIKIINSFEWREELLKEESSTEVKERKCPTIILTIQGIKINALIDSGSQVSCISEEFFTEHDTSFKKCPILPVTGVSVIGATKGKPVKLKKQVYADIKIMDLETSASLLVVPNLTRRCIIGVDILKALGGLIDLEKDALTLQLNDQIFIISTKEEEEEEEASNKIISRIVHDEKNDDDLTREKLKKILQNNDRIDGKRLKKYEELI